MFRPYKNISTNGGNYYADLTGTNDYTGVVNGLSLPTKGTPINVLPTITNTGAITVNLFGSAIPVVKIGGIACKAGDWPANTWQTINYDGTKYQCTSITGNLLEE